MYWTILTLCICLFAAANGIVVSKQLNVTLNHGGILIGRHLTSHHGRNVRGFLGIPYAKPPIGDLRFKAPVPADPWVGERMAIADGNICSQVDVFFSDNLYQGVEDCLYLNVYIPENPKSRKPLPVMVWIHGGGYLYGNGMMGYYDPKLLMDRDIVFVSLNYRVGTLGFLSSETLDIPGNFGLKDQLLALKWVQEHISVFGGDPKSVTIFGESAGGASVAYLTNSHKTQGLFHRAIVQSGSFYNRWGLPSPRGYASDLARKISNIVGCNSLNGNWNTTLKCLQSVPARNLTEAANEFLAWRYLPWPVVPLVVEPEHEEAFLTQPPELTNRSKSVPMIIGFNKDEGISIYALRKVLPIDQMNVVYQEYTPYILNYELTSERNQNMIKKLIDEFYFKNQSIDYENFTKALSDSWFIGGIDKLIYERAALAQNVETYVYEFDNKGLSIVYVANDEYLGTSHLDGLFYLYPVNEVLLPTTAPNHSDWQLREIMLDLWTNFATHGVPTPHKSKNPKWVPMESYPPKMMRIGRQCEEEPFTKMISEYPIERMNFWRQLEPLLEYDDL